MTVFIDTSALYAALDDADPQHDASRRAFGWLAAADEPLMTHSYVLVESIALLHRRLGVEGVRQLVADLLPLIEVHWVDAALHSRAVASVVAAGRRVSFVDRVSFEVMRDRGIDRALAFNDDFVAQGFTVIDG
jgi:uncharacterized protein